MRRAQRRSRAETAGFTLVELLTVVAIMGVLAALAVVGVRKHFNDAKSLEATAMVQAIRSGQEARRSEVGVYLECTAPGAVTWYPAAPDGQIRSWQFSSHTDYPRWRLLGVSRPEGVRFGYLVHAGIAGAAITVPQTGQKPVWPTPTDPWYVIQAAADQDNDGVKMLVLASSLGAGVYFENEGE